MDQGFKYTKITHISIKPDWQWMWGGQGSFKFYFVIHPTFIDHLLCDEHCASIWVIK